MPWVRRFNHRNYPVEFFLLANCRCSGSCGFAANVNNRRTIIEHLSRLSQRKIKASKLTAIRKRIRRDIKHAHDYRAAEVQHAGSNASVRWQGHLWTRSTHS